MEKETIGRWGATKRVTKGRPPVYLAKTPEEAAPRRYSVLLLSDPENFYRNAETSKRNRARFVVEVSSGSSSIQIPVGGDRPIEGTRLTVAGCWVRVRAEADELAPDESYPVSALICPVTAGEPAVASGVIHRVVPFGGGTLTVVPGNPYRVGLSLYITKTGGGAGDTFTGVYGDANDFLVTPYPTFLVPYEGIGWTMPQPVYTGAIVGGWNTPPVGAGAGALYVAELVL